MKESLYKLFRVKSIVTLTLTFVFAYLSIIGKLSSEMVMTIYTTVIAFYFGTQHQKIVKDIKSDIDSYE